MHWSFVFWASWYIPIEDVTSHSESMGIRGDSSHPEWEGLSRMLVGPNGESRSRETSLADLVVERSELVAVDGDRVAGGRPEHPEAEAESAYRSCSIEIM